MPIVCSGQLDDSFEGWDGESLFVFVNGQKWQQARYAYRYHYAYRPQALVVQEGGRYFLKVHGLNERLEVRRIY
jgi:hypothetical protein